MQSGTTCDLSGQNPEPQKTGKRSQLLQCPVVQNWKGLMSRACMYVQLRVCSVSTEAAPRCQPSVVPKVEVAHDCHFPPELSLELTALDAGSYPGSAAPTIGPLTVKWATCLESGQEDFVLRLQHKGVAGIAERKISFSGRRHARLWQRVLNQKESSNELPQG